VDPAQSIIKPNNLAGVLKVIAQPLPPLSHAARQFSEANWRFSAISRQALAIYRKILQKR
jgi:hypothetical protein